MHQKIKTKRLSLFLSKSIDLTETIELLKRSLKIFHNFSLLYWAYPDFCGQLKFLISFTDTEFHFMKIATYVQVI